MANVVASKVFQKGMQIAAPAVKEMGTQALQSGMSIGVQALGSLISGGHNPQKLATNLNTSLATYGDPNKVSSSTGKDLANVAMNALNTLFSPKEINHVNDSNLR